MITLIVGDTGVGKTALNMLFLLREYEQQRHWLLKNAITKIKKWNRDRKLKLSIPDRAPIYSSFEAKIHTGYKKWFKPYDINPEKVGVPDEAAPPDTEFLLPGAKVHISEVQNIWDSRASNMPIYQSKLFEEGRHFGMDFVLDAQRGGRIDLNIRGIAHLIIEVQYMEHEKDEFDDTIKTTWHCREFNELRDYENYLSSGVGYKETTYEYEGNIFDFYNSTSCEKEFIPPEGQDFSLRG